jgi:hypothetical protein
MRADLAVVRLETVVGFDEHDSRWIDAAAPDRQLVAPAGGFPELKSPPIFPSHVQREEERWHSASDPPSPLGGGFGYEIVAPRSRHCSAAARLTFPEFSAAR